MRTLTQIVVRPLRVNNKQNCRYAEDNMSPSIPNPTEVYFLSSEPGRDCRQATEIKILHAAEGWTLHPAVQNPRVPGRRNAETARSAPVPHDHCRSTKSGVSSSAASSTQDYTVLGLQGNSRRGFCVVPYPSRETKFCAS